MALDKNLLKLPLFGRIYLSELFNYPVFIHLNLEWYWFNRKP